MRRIDAMLASTQPRRSSTPTTTWPGVCKPGEFARDRVLGRAGERRRSRRATTRRGTSRRGRSRPATNRATRRAVAQSTGSGTAGGASGDVTGTSPGVRATLHLEPADAFQYCRSRLSIISPKNQHEERCGPEEPEVAAGAVDHSVIAVSTATIATSDPVSNDRMVVGLTPAPPTVGPFGPAPGAIVLKALSRGWTQGSRPDDLGRRSSVRRSYASGSRSRARSAIFARSALGASSRHFDTITRRISISKVKPSRARRALVEVPGDGPALPHRQLTVEVFVDAEDRAGRSPSRSTPRCRIDAGA